MKAMAPAITLLLLAVLVLPAHADNRKKAQKQSNKITAMATDPTGRRVVSISMADVLGLDRAALMRQRRAMNLNYGSLFIAHELAKSGMKMLDIATELQSGKTIWEIADKRGADWNTIADDTKKLNKKIEANLYQYFVDSSAIQDRDEQEHYRVIEDGVRADSQVSVADLEEAQRVYQWWRDHASANQDRMLDTATEHAAYNDHVRNGGPQSQGSSIGSLAPAAGGIPQR